MLWDLNEADLPGVAARIDFMFNIHVHKRKLDRVNTCTKIKKINKKKYTGSKLSLLKAKQE